MDGREDNSRIPRAESPPDGPQGLSRGIRANRLLAAGAALMVAWIGFAGLLRTPANHHRPSGVDDSSSEAPKPLSYRALSPTIQGVVTLDQAAIEQLVIRMTPRKKPAAPVLLHALHIFGQDTRIVLASGECRPVVDLLLDADQGHEFFGTYPIARTRFGARFPIQAGMLLGTPQQGAATHRGQAMAVLGELGIPLKRPVRLPEGEAMALSAVLDDLVANFSMDGEIYWDATAVALYLPPVRRWQNKFGREFTFDELAAELIRRPIDDPVCAGTHRLTTLAVLLRVDDEARILAGPVRRQVHDHLGRVASFLGGCQLEDGSWGVDWHEPLSPAGEDAHRAHKDEHAHDRDVWPKILATGHNLEWMMLLPEDLRPPRAVFEKGAKWLLPNLLKEVGDDLPPPEFYCPASHGLKAVRTLAVARHAS
jgi:hypothetical protein